MLEIRLLGQFHLEHEGVPVELSSRPGQSLLAYLVMHAGKAVRREMIGGLLWPESSESNARNNLRQALWRVRTSLAAVTDMPYLIVNDLAITFDADADYWLDVDHLSTARPESASLDELAAVADLYAGELLPGFYDDWVVLERERVHARYEQHMLLLLNRLEEAGEWTELSRWSERWIALGTVPEPAYRAVMIARAAQGDLAGMAATFQRCEVAMRETLGLDPAPATRDLFEQLKEGSPVVPAQLHPALEMPSSPPALGTEDSAAPYKGLQHYDREDARFFFGRDELTRELVARVTREQRFLAIVGASGSGKSSIVRAGLIPALTGEKSEIVEDSGTGRWRVVLLSPTAQPLKALAEGLHRAGFAAGSAADVQTAWEAAADDLGKLLQIAHEADDSPANPLTRSHGPADDATNILFVVDQFEELFTLCRSERERRAFIATLLHIARAEQLPRAGVVVTLRSDFYGHCGHYPELRVALAEQQVYLGPMNARELREAIEGPAAVGGWRLEPGLVELILRDVADEPGGLPLLSHALLETWRRRQGRTLVLEGYAKSGGVRGAIARTAESVFQQQLTPEEQQIARNIFVRLTALGEGTEDTRRRAALSELYPAEQEPAPVRTVLEVLAEARLITVDEDGIEIAHEALISEWPTLRTWLAEDRADIRLHRHLTESAQEWEGFERNESELYRGARLSQAIEWQERRQPLLSPLERDFLAASRARAERLADERRAQEEHELRQALELAQARQQQAETERQSAEDRVRSYERLRRRTVYLTITLFVALILTGVALFLREQVRRTAETAQANAERAELESEVAFSRELAAASAANLSGDSELSLLLALAAVSNAQESGIAVPREAVEALHWAVSSSRLRASFENGFNAAFSPDGTQLAHSGPGSTAIVRTFPSGSEQHVLDGHSGDQFGVNVLFDTSQSRILTASADGSAMLWDAESGEALLRMGAHEGSITDATLSADGRWAATSGDDDTVRVWDLRTGEEYLRLAVTGSSGVAFDSAAEHLATARDLPGAGHVSIWDLATGRELLTLAGHERGSGDVIYSADGRQIFTSGFDATVKMWDAETGVELTTLTDLSPVYSLALSPDGNLIALGAVNGDASVWDLETEDVLYRFSGHMGWVTSVAFSPDGHYLATSGSDGATRIWDISITGASEWLALDGHDSVVYSVDYSQDGNRLATSSWDGSVKIWDASDGSHSLDLTEGDAEVARVVFSPENRGVVTADYSGAVRVWADRTGVLRRTILAHPSGDIDVAVAPGGKLMGTGGTDGIGRLWSMETGDLLHELVGHRDVVARVAFNANGTLFGTASWDGTARIWHVGSGELMMILSEGAGNVNSVDFSADGRFVATAHDDGVARIWALSDAAGEPPLEPALSLSGHSSTVWDAVFSPDSSTVATIGFDGVVKLWDVRSGSEVLMLPGENNGPDLAFSPDGTLLAATGGDGVVRVYVLSLDKLMELARARLTRDFSEEECAKYLHLDSCP